MSRPSIDDLKLERDGTLFVDPKLEIKREREWLASQPGTFAVTVHGTREIIVEHHETYEVVADSEDDAKELAEEQARLSMDLDRWDHDGTDHTSYGAIEVERLER